MTADQRHEALTAIRSVEERLSAWHDNAELMLRQAHNNISEERWQNERDNYASCLRDLDNAKRILLGEC